MTQYPSNVTWGEALKLRAYHRLDPRVRHIQTVVGQEYGSRNTYGKLFKVETPEELTKEGDQVRAWLLLAATGAEPNDWGIPDDVLPLGFHPGILRDLLPRESLADSRVCFTEQSEDGPPIILGMSPSARDLQLVAP
jgi:hypothetical protein